MSTTAKQKEIIELEQVYGIELTELGFEQYDESEFWDNRNHFVLNSVGEVIALNLNGNKITKTEGLEHLTALNKLDLRDNKISEIKGLEQLTALKELVLNGNYITEIKGLEQLTDLNKLGLDGNQIVKIEGLEHLTALNTLSLYRNQITKIEGLEHLTALNTLNLNDNQITKIKGLEQLTALKELSLDYNQITKIEGLEQLTALNTLKLNNNQITKIEGLEQLTGLNTLNLNDNQITKIEGLEQLTALKELYLDNNQITEIKGLDKLNCIEYLWLNANRISVIKGLEELKSLSWLDLSENQITEIKGLEKLGALIRFELKYNQITEIKGLELLTGLNHLYLGNNIIKEISGLESLAALNTLDMEGNKITEIKGLEHMNALNLLNLSFNQITQIKGLDKLKALTKLKLRDNRITEIKGLEQLLALKELNLGNNQIAEIKGLEMLLFLKWLNLNSNQISEIRGLDQLTELNVLFLRKNRITQIKGLENLKKLKSLHLSGNPIENTTISDLNDFQAILGYLESLQDQTQLIDNFDVKVNILGTGRIGKSQLFNWLTKNNFQEGQPETHGTGVDIYKPNEQYRASLWDFGGQSYQHGTHSLFLRPRDFYLIMHHSEKIEHPYAYWLGAARTFSPDKKDNQYVSPVFLVQSVWSDNNNQTIYPHSETIKNYLINPKHIFSVDVKYQNEQSAWKAENDYFIQKLNDEIVSYAKSFGQVPKKFMNVMLEIRANPFDDIYIQKSEFKEKYAKDYSEADFAYLLQYLEFTGTIIFFREKGLLADYVFTNPKDLSEWIYKTILNKKLQKQKNGTLDFTQVIKSFGEDKAWVFKELMLDFNLLFEEKGNENNLVIPQFLPENNNSFKKVILELIPFTFSIRFQDFIYEGRIFNFISEYGEYAQDKSSYWKYGILFNYNDIQSIVYYNTDERTIYVHLEQKKGFERSAREILDYFILKQNREDFTFGPIRLNKFLAEYSLSINDFNDVYFDRFGSKLLNPNDKITVEQREWLANHFKRRKTELRTKKHRLNAEMEQFLISKKELASKWSTVDLDNIHGMEEIKELKVDSFIFGSQLSTNGKNYFDIINTIKLNIEGNSKVGHCLTTNKLMPLDLLTLKMLGMNDKKLKKVFLSYNRKDLKYKEELKSHLSILDRYGLISAWSCDQIKAGTWHNQIQKELEGADIIIYMVSHNFMDSEYIMEEEVKKGIKIVENDPSKKIICVLTGVCQWKNWDTLEKLHKENVGENANYSSMNLSQFQFLPYHQYREENGDIKREEIVALEQWGRYPWDVINVAYNQIVNRVLQEI